MVMSTMFDSIPVDEDEEDKQAPPSPPPPQPDPLAGQLGAALAANPVTGSGGGQPNQPQNPEWQQPQPPEQPSGGLLERGLSSAASFLGQQPIPFVGPGLSIATAGLNQLGINTPNIGNVGGAFEAQNQAMGQYSQALNQIPGYSSLPAPVQAGAEALPYALLPGGPEGAAQRAATAFGSGVAGYGAQQGAAQLGAGPVTQQAAGLLGGIGTYEAAGALNRVNPVPTQLDPLSPTPITSSMRDGSPAVMNLEEWLHQPTPMEMGKPVTAIPPENVGAQQTLNSGPEFPTPYKTPTPATWATPDVGDGRTFSTHQVGDYTVSVDNLHGGPNDLMVSIERATSPFSNATPEDPGGLRVYEGRNLPGGSVSGLRGVGEFVRQLAEMNPDARILADASDARRGAIYQRAGFDQLSNGLLQLNPERFGRTLGPETSLPPSGTPTTGPTETSFTTGPYPPPDSFASPEHQQGYYQGLLDSQQMAPHDFLPTRGPDDGDFQMGYKEARLGMPPGQLVNAPMSGLPEAPMNAPYPQSIAPPATPWDQTTQFPDYGKQYDQQQVVQNLINNARPGSVAPGAPDLTIGQAGAMNGVNITNDPARSIGYGGVPSSPAMSVDQAINVQNAAQNAWMQQPGSNPFQPPSSGGRGAPPTSPPGGAPPIGRPLTPGPDTFVQQWQAGNEARYQQESPTGQAWGQAIRTITGHPEDTWLAGMVERRPILERWLANSGMTPAEQAETLNNAVRYDATRFFNGDMPRVTDALQELKDFDADVKSTRQANQGTSTFIDRFKNTVFGADFGVVGVNTLSAMREGGIPAFMGQVNRMANALSLPGPWVDLEKMTGLPRLDAMRNAGVDLRGGERIRTQGEGTLLSYFPGLSVVDQRLITPVLDRLTDAQYNGVVGYGKATTFEGQLLMNKLAGIDVSSPRAQASAAKVTNDIWSSGRTATEPGRAALEKDVLLSPGMTRAQASRIFDMGQLVNPFATYPERVAAAGMVLSNILFVTTVGKLINDKIGMTDWVSNPLQPGFGTITLPTTDSAGRHHVISLLSQGTLERALINSIATLQQGDPEDLKQIWEKFAFGRANPILGDAAKLATGAGYDTQGHFFTGFDKDNKMSMAERLRSSIPVPQVAQGPLLQGKTDAVTAGLAAGGLNEYPEGLGAQKVRLGSEILDNPGRLSQAFPDNPVMPQLLAGKDWNDLFPSEKAALQKVMDPQELQSIRAESYRQNPGLTTHSEVVAQLQQEKTAKEDVMLDMYNRGELDRPHLINQMKAAQQEYYSLKDKLDADPRYKSEVANIQKNGNPTQAQNLLDTYYKIADQFPNDRAARQQAQDDYIHHIMETDPAMGARLLTAVQPQNQSRLEAMYYSGQLR